MDRELLVEIPLLFYRSEEKGVLQILVVGIDREGEGLLDHRIGEALRELEFSLPPRGTGLLKTLLPRRTKRSHYGCGYHRPPEEIDLFSGGFPEGYSHFLMILLGFYALGADELLGGEAFRGKLAGWAATGYPDKAGAIRSVERIPEKLAIIFEENESLVREFRRPAIERILVPALNRDELGGGTGPIDVAGPEGGKITAHPVGTFEEALRTVFGEALLSRYRRALWIRRRLLPALALAGALAVAAVGLLVLLRRPEPVAVEVIGADSESIRILYEDGEAHAGPFGAVVAVHELGEDGEKVPRHILLGLTGPGERRGDVLRLDRNWLGSWRETWRTRLWEGCSDLRSGARIRLDLRRLRIADVLPRVPGDEVVALAAGVDGTSALVILSADGKLVGRLWHPGTLEEMALLSDPPRIVAIACQNALPSRGEPSLYIDEYDRVVFSVKAENVEGSGPVYRDGKWVETWVDDPVFRTGPCDFEFYSRILPKGLVSVNGPTDLTTDAPDMPEGAEVRVAVTGWSFYLDRHGRIVERVPSTSDVEHEPHLEPVEPNNRPSRALKGR